MPESEHIAPGDAATTNASSDTSLYDFKPEAGSPQKSDHSTPSEPQSDHTEDSLPSLIPKTWTPEEAQLFLKNRKWRIAAQQRRINDLEGEVADFRADAEKAGICYPKARYGVDSSRSNLKTNEGVQTLARGDSWPSTEGSRDQVGGKTKWSLNISSKQYRSHVFETSV